MTLPLPLYDGDGETLQFILDRLAQAVIDTGNREVKLRWGSADIQSVDFSGGFGSGAGPFNVRIAHGQRSVPVIAVGGLDTGISTGDTEDISQWAWRNTAWDSTYFYIRYAPRTGTVNFPAVTFYWIGLF